MKRIFIVILALTMTLSAFSVSANGGRDISGHEMLAKDLKALGLFHGISDTDFDLDRAPTRVEAVIMLVRLLGKSTEATSSSWNHPFTDVPAWADNYVGYAYQNGLSYGVSDTQFGTSDATAEMYLTFVLRALGYDDGGGGDFVWNDPFTLAGKIGILPESVNKLNFWRADVALVSYAALNAKIKGENTKLAEKLISEGVFTKEQFSEKYDVGKISLIPVSKELTAEQLYEKYSSAVFYIEIFDRTGKLTSTGSGFFIDGGGTAVTNYHVIDGAASAKATIADTGEKIEIKGVYDFDKENDWAIIKVGDDSFSCNYLPIGDASTVVGGSTVYTIGSPLGLQNTISQGLISNVNRELDGVSYIQISAPISHGSSGGALINKFGEVIGITSAGFTDGENLNLAIPITVISGYSKTSIKTLTEIFFPNSSYAPTPENPGVNLPADGNLTREEDAYLWLRAFVNAYANNDYEGNKSYAKTRYTDNGTINLEIISFSDYISFEVFETFKTSTYYCSIDIKPGYRPFLYYSFNTGNTYYYKNGEYFDASKVYRGRPFYFSGGEGTAVKSTNENICGGYVDILLVFINDIFKEYISEFERFTVADFGFVNFR